MRAAAKDSKPHRPVRVKFAVLAALLALSAAALAPASAGAVANQTTDCRNMPIPDVGLVPGMGWNPVGGYVCKLDSAGDIYGGTDKKASTPTPTPPICTGRSCLPLQAGQTGPGSNEVPGPRPGRPTFPGKAKPGKKLTKAEKEQAAKELAERNECIDLLRAGKIGTPMYVLEANAQRSISFIEGEMQAKDHSRARASLDGRPREAEELRNEISAMRREINATRRALENVKKDRDSYFDKGCSTKLGR